MLGEKCSSLSRNSSSSSSSSSSSCCSSVPAMRDRTIKIFSLCCRRRHSECGQQRKYSIAERYHNDNSDDYDHHHRQRHRHQRNQSLPKNIFVNNETTTTSCKNKHHTNNHSNSSDRKYDYGVWSTGFLLIKTMFILQIIVCLLPYNCHALSSSSSSSTASPQSSSLLSITPDSASSSIISSYFTSNMTINFTHIASDRFGRIYVGAANWLYQFNASLGMEASLRTGPVQDSPLCSPTDCSGVDSTTISGRNNVNKVLVVDEESKILLVCGTVHQGACRRHRLGAITQQEELIPSPIAANDENSSTLAFIGPSRYFGTKVTPALYVAATNSRVGTYRDMVPAISTRSLEAGSKYLTIIEKSFTDTAKVDIEFHMKDYFLVNYVYGFATQDFVYFALVQKKSHLRALEEWGYVTRLARVCQSDAGYNTYTEVTLQCFGRDGTDYTLLQDAVVVTAGEDLAKDLRVAVGDSVLIGVFTTAIDHTSHASYRSAICVYSIAEIEQKFTQNIHMCYNGSVATRNMDYIAGNLPDCPTLGRGGNIVSFCSETLKLNGSQPIVSTSAITYENSTLTAVVALTTGQHTVAFVGTRNGHLKKLLISKSDLAEEFEEVEVDYGNPILSDMIIDAKGQHIYCASPYKIVKIAIERCGHYTSCRECLQARNPYCGWCTLQKSCTLKRECRDINTSSSSRWLSLDTQQCIDFQSIKPESLPITSTEKVELVINQLPKLPHGANYQCVFGDGPPIDAQPTTQGLICRTPPVSWRPQTPAGFDHIMVDLSVRSSETKTDFLHRKFAFFDCNAHKTCADCVQSEWHCKWCVNDNKCSQTEQKCSHNSLITNNEMYPQSLSSSAKTVASSISEYKYCPSFDLHNKILLPNGFSKEIILPVKNLPNANSSFACVVDIEDSKTQVSARVEDNRIICAETAYSYRTEIGSITASLTVLWNGDSFVDKANVTLYKCHLLGSHNGRADCSLCLTLSAIYECRWCNSQCSYANKCQVPPVSVCPPPRIDWMHPLSGPIQGGTIVTIEGSNLGTSMDEIRDKITIGGQPCVALNYSVSVRVTCRTSAVNKALTADVIVGNRAGFTGARDKYHYDTVDLQSSQPNIGPQSGGTRIYISGNNLNIGSNIEVYLDYLPCIVDKTLASSSQISCRTTAANTPSHIVRNLILKVDNATLTLPRPFRYVPDPTIMRIYPLKSYMSGGRTVTVIGTNLNAIQQPRLAIFCSEGNIINESACEVVSHSQMVCPSPSVNPEMSDLFYREQLDASSLVSGHSNEFPDDIRLRIGFIMDAVNSVKELGVNFPTVHSDLGYVADPKFFPFDDNVKLYKGESLVIEGENLRLASTESEVNVTIGTKSCNLTSLASTQLVCMPPELQPFGTDEIGRRTANSLPMVVVRVGSTLRYEIGYLQYEVVKSYELPPIAIIAITICSLALILFVLISLGVMRHKSSQAEREYKRIQMQMDTLENSVRSECKQAFAELQTDMTDLTNDLESCGVPTLDHRSYVMKVFFPGLTDHPLYQCTKMRTNGAYNIYELAMTQFEQLLNNKPFLIAFINTLESQKTFTIKDRVNVASLLMIILMERMEYATDVLRTLLYQLVEKSVMSKHPQLMLRRTESVVEKMLTNWLALSMYDYMREHANASLFLLFSAIKRQVEKGPIDACTHDARYSLSEERLLRDHYCCYEQVIIQVQQQDNNSDSKILCRVNDCDTISQVKAKILDSLYKNTPFSLRPSIHDVDLEWRHGSGGHLTLQDEDLTTKTEHGWQRINTLKHYGVKNWAVMSLILKQSNDSYISCSTKNSLSPIIGSKSATTMSLISTDIDHDRYWHLIKPTSDHCSDAKDCDRLHKAIPEIFLTRLLSTKGTVQKFVTDFFQTLLSANNTLSAVKWLFDLLDACAVHHTITDPEVIHAWKSNCLPLRFWVNFIKNPDFILDVCKTPTLDSCLSVIAQTLMDSCSTSEHRLGKDSPSNKLLFAKDIPAYRNMVCKFYSDVSVMPSITDQELSATMQCLSLTHTGEFDVICALKELFVYAVKYKAEIMDSIQRDSNTQQTTINKFMNLINYKF